MTFGFFLVNKTFLNIFKYFLNNFWNLYVFFNSEDDDINEKLSKLFIQN